LSVTETAQRLGVSSASLSRLLNGKAAVSIDMALRLEAWIKGPTAESWLTMQSAYDLWQAKQQPRPQIKPLQAA
jgi:addiction module HigA family antidote